MKLISAFILVGGLGTMSALAYSPAAAGRGRGGGVQVSVYCGPIRASADIVCSVVTQSITMNLVCHSLRYDLFTLDAEADLVLS